MARPSGKCPVQSGRQGPVKQVTNSRSLRALAKQIIRALRVFTLATVASVAPTYAAPIDIPIEAAIESSISVPVESPIEAPIEAPLEAPIQAPQNAKDCGDSVPASYSKIVLIIDDIGHSLERGRQALALPGKITYAVIPFTPHSVVLAGTAEAVGKEVMVHAPMSNQSQKPMGEGALTAELSRDDFRARLLAGIDSLPQARGVNNHMGSDLTERRRQMAWLMQELRWRDLYFVDSRTSENTIAATVAREFRVPNLSRHVFLDNKPNPEAIHVQFEELVSKAKKLGLAVGIGHPYPATIEYLRNALPQLEAQGIRLAFVSEGIQTKSELLQAKRHGINLAQQAYATHAGNDTCEEPEQQLAKGTTTRNQTQAKTQVLLTVSGN